MGTASTLTSKCSQRRILAVLELLLFVGGVAVLAWPVATDWYFAWQAEQAIQEVTSTYDAMGDPERLECLEQAHAWNDRQLGRGNPGAELWDYDWQLTWHSTPESMMAWLDVPKIGTRLPIYHGTEQATLMAGVGHCEWSSLPVGGTGTHCVLTAHSGMDRTRMFDDIRLLQEGDVFVVWSLEEPYAYRVTRTQTVLPNELQSLQPANQKDLCTLVTCTPYGVNTHRLLVTGERCDYEPEVGQTSGPAVYVNRRTTPLLLGVAAVVIAGMVLRIWHRRRTNRRPRASS